MLDRLYKETQDLLNKAQMGYLPPNRFNLFVNGAVDAVYGWVIEEVRRANRRKNWGLHGATLADYSKYREELLEYFITEVEVDVSGFSTPTPSTDPATEGTIVLPGDYRYYLDMRRKSDNKSVTKLDYLDFNLAKRNNYVAPSSQCNLLATRRGTVIKIMPASFSNVEDDKLLLTYLRNPRIAVWAYQEINGQAQYNATASVDVDMPDALYDELLTLTCEKAGLSIRDNNVVSQANTDQVQQSQNINRD